MEAETSFVLGKFLVLVRLRADNPAFPVFVIFRGKRLIGKQFSYPTEEDCRWLERTNGVFAEPSEEAKQEYGWTASTVRRRKRLKAA